MGILVDRSGVLVVYLRSVHFGHTPSYYFCSLHGNNEFNLLCATWLASLKAQIEDELKSLNHRSK